MKFNSHIFVLFFLISSGLNACEIQLSPILLFMSKTMTPYDWQPLMKNSNCSPEITQNIFEKLKESEGKISTQQLVSDYNTKVTITPSILEVVNLETLLRMKTHSFFKKISITGTLSSRLILLDKWDEITLQCQNCEDNNWNNSKFGKLGQRESTLLWQLQLTNNNQIKNLLLTTELINVKKVLKAKSPIEIGSSINQDLLEISYVADDLSQKYFHDNLSTLTNFELIKSMVPGDVLTLSHLKTKRLVQLGKNISAIIKKNGIELTLPAQALQSGGLGETIQIKNLKNNKQLSAEIIGQSKVLITL